MDEWSVKSLLIEIIQFYVLNGLLLWSVCALIAGWLMVVDDVAVDGERCCVDESSGPSCCPILRV